MTDILEAKQDLLEYVKSLNYKFELSKTVEADYFEPGMMENLEQYRGEYDDASNTVVLRVERPGFDNGLTIAQKNHPSEVDMDNYFFDFIVYNDAGLDDFTTKLVMFTKDCLLCEV